MNLPRSSPSARGIDSRGIVDLVAAAEARGLDLHGLMVARHGSVVAEAWWAPYGPDSPTLVYSLSKSLTALAIAMAEHDGYLNLTDPILPHLGIDPGSVAPIWSDVRVEHCLNMTVGFGCESDGLVYDRMRPRAARDGDWLGSVLATPPTEQPGHLFTYCQAPTYLLSRLHRQVTGRGLADALASHLPDVFPSGSLRWVTDPTGSELGYSGAHVTTESILSLAQLHLDKGRWHGESVTTEDWTTRAMHAAVDTRGRTEGPDWSRGYGFSFWLQRHGYRADGAYGQLALVLPAYSMVVAITAEEPDPQALLDLVWAHLLPAVDRPGSADADEELGRFLAARSLPLTCRSDVATPPEGMVAAFDRGPGSTLPPSWRGVSVRPGASGGRHMVDFACRDEVLSLPVATDCWLPSRLRATAGTAPVAANGGWVNGQTYVAEVVLSQTPHRFRAVADRRTGLVDLSWRIPGLAGLDPFQVSR